jgi:hypothetical protein
VPAVETVLVLLAAATTTSPAASAAGRYEAPGCVLTNQPSRIGLCSSPGVQAGRLHFRDAASPHWYQVEMVRDEGCLWGTLPSAQKRIRRIAYFLELSGPAGPSARTPERLLRVVDESSACPHPPVAPIDVADPPFVTATAGAPLTPAGFGEAGGRAVPWLAGVLVAGGAAGTAVAVGAAGGGSPAPREPEVETPAPTAPPPTLPPPTAPPTAAPPPPPPPPPPRPTATPEPPDDGTPPPPPPPPPTAPPPAPTATPRPTSTAAPTATPTPRPGATSTPEPTSTPAPRATATPTPGTTPTPDPRATATPEPRATPTPTPGPTNTPAATPTATPSSPTPTPTTAPTPTPAPQPTSTPTPAATPTPPPRSTPSSDDDAEAASARSVSWRSQLSVPGGHARVSVNGRPIAEGGDGVVERVFAAVRGENRVEIEILQARGAGRAVVQLGGRAFDASTLRVAEGTGTVVGPGSVVARLRGQPGERLTLVFVSSP